MIIVCGGTGFIGFYLVNYLHDSGYDVLAIDKGGDEEAAYFKSKGIKFQQLDIANASALNHLPANGVTAFINLACAQPATMSSENYDPKKYVSTNIVGVTNILDYCFKNGIRKVLHTISHRNVQGLWKKGETIFEDSPRAIEFSGKYAMFSISESAAADIIEYYNQEHNMQGIIFRLPSVYGFGHHEYLFDGNKITKTGLGVFIDKAQKAEPIEIWGDRNKGRDVVYVKDVVLAIGKAIESKTARGMFNIASGKKLSLQEQVDAIIKVFSASSNQSEIIYKPEKPNAIEACVYNIDKAYNELRWKPQFSFEDMLMDYKQEISSEKWGFLLERKKRMAKENL